MRYQDMLDEFARLNARLARLERSAERKPAPAEEYRQVVDTFRPELRGDQQYEVTLAWRCSCPSFTYQTGVDERGHCKHIRAARSWRNIERRQS